MDESQVMGVDDWEIYLTLLRLLENKKYREAQLLALDTRPNHIGRRMAISSLEKHGCGFPDGCDLDTLALYRTNHEQGAKDEIYTAGNYETKKTIDKLFSN
jgi:hypothetical protein